MMSLIILLHTTQNLKKSNESLNSKRLSIISKDNKLNLDPAREGLMESIMTPDGGLPSSEECVTNDDNN